MSGKNVVHLVTFKRCRTKCQVDFLTLLGYFHLAKIPKLFQSHFTQHIISYKLKVKSVALGFMYFRILGVHLSLHCFWLEL